MELLHTIHIIFGTFLLGCYLFTVLILMPILKRLGPAIRHPVMNALMPVLTPVTAIGAFIIFGTGVQLALVALHGIFDTVFVTAWGWDMIAGLILTLALGVVGFAVMVPQRLRVDHLIRSIKGREPSVEETIRLDKLSAEDEATIWVNFALIAAALVTMLVARYL